jgi:hypothetical protein
MTNSTTSAGWIRKTNFKEDKVDPNPNPDPIEASTRIMVARHHAALFIESDIKEYSQWFEGKKNQVAVPSFRSSNNQTMTSLTLYALFSHLSYQSISKLYHCQSTALG